MARSLPAVIDRPIDALASLGAQLRFHLRVLLSIPQAIRRYSREIVRLLGQVTFGSGALAVIGGTVGVMVSLSLFTGAVVGLQGYSALNAVGTAPLTGFLSAYFNTREIAPLVAGLALAATVGCGFTAQLGSMRISEEIDALEVMAIRSVPFLVTCRVVAGMIAVVPLYIIGLLVSYIGSRVVTVYFYGQSGGTYDHYFTLFLPPGDILLSFLKVLFFAIVIMLVHCFYGFTAKGGPAGVGEAVGRAIRLSIVSVSVLDFFLSLAIWGSTTTVRIAG
jgi:phospholipid/cholesterol/gamma-HCH transport system permease protein